MYKYPNKQISFSDFGQPVGMRMSAENRWVKKAESIPWEEIEQRYAALFTNKKGNVAKPLRLALGACIIQAEYGYSDEEVRLVHICNSFVALVNTRMSRRLTRL